MAKMRARLKWRIFKSMTRQFFYRVPDWMQQLMSFLKGLTGFLRVWFENRRDLSLVFQNFVSFSMGINFFCSSSAAADILSWLHSQRTIVFVLFWARALASSNLSRLLLSQAQSYPGPSSSQKRKTLLSLNFLFRNIFVQLEKLSALPIYFLIFDESVKFSNFFLLDTLLRWIHFPHWVPPFRQSAITPTKEK